MILTIVLESPIRESDPDNKFLLKSTSVKLYKAENVGIFPPRTFFFTFKEVRFTRLVKDGIDPLRKFSLKSSHTMLTKLLNCGMLPMNWLL